MDKAPPNGKPLYPTNNNMVLAILPLMIENWVLLISPKQVDLFCTST